MEHLQSFGPLPTVRQMEHLQLGKKAFFHFGVNTFTDREWGDGGEPEQAFAPKQVDCRQWIRSVRAAGFKLAIITAKHHDGFCLWDSKLTDHTVKNSPYGKDVVREFTDACREYGVLPGVYLSPWDRHAPGWGSDSYNDFYVGQLTELLSNYGPIYEVWWDGAGSKDTPYDWGRWAYTVRNLQPRAAIFGSRGGTPYAEVRWVGNEAGYAGDPHYPILHSHDLEVENNKALNHGTVEGDRLIPAEVDVSTRPGWFYHEEQEYEVKSVEQLVRLWYQSVGRGAMMLLNFPPNRDGKLPQKDTENAIKAHQLVEKMLAANLAADGTAACLQQRSVEYEAQNILTDWDEACFAAKDDAKKVEITVTLPEARRFNTFLIGEYIPLGVRVTGYRVSANTKEGWKVLAEKQSIGYLWAEYFEEVTANEVKIELDAFLAPPVLRCFGLYYMEENPYQSSQIKKAAMELTKKSNARVIYDEHTATVEFGGIYPYNTVSFCGDGMWKYKIEAFNGSEFYEIHCGTCPANQEVIRLPEPIEGTYQLRLTSERSIDSGLGIRVFYEE